MYIDIAVARPSVEGNKYQHLGRYVASQMYRLALHRLDNEMLAYYDQQYYLLLIIFTISGR